MTEQAYSTSTVVVLAAHGSRAATANDAHRALAERLAGATGCPVGAAFLELAEPSIAGAIDDAATRARTVLVLPYFLHPGRHLSEDVPAIVADAGRRHPDVAVQLLGAFGAEPAVIDLLADQVGRAVRPPT